MEKNPERLVVENLIQYEDDKTRSYYKIWIKRNPPRTLYSIERVGNNVEIESYSPNSSQPPVPSKITLVNGHMENITRRLIAAWDYGFYVGEGNRFFITNLLHQLFVTLVGANRILAFERKIYGNDIPGKIEYIKDALIMEDYRLVVDKDPYIKMHKYSCYSFDLNTISWLRKIAGPNQSYAYECWLDHHRSKKSFPALKNCTYKILD